MNIKDITCRVVTIPLVTTFKTALRRVDSIDNVIVTVTTESGLAGYGSAAPAAVITGETVGSISAGVMHIRGCLVGMSIEKSEDIFQRLNNCIVGCMSAKAAVDMAIYDLVAKVLDIPLYRLFGGQVNEVETDMTVSLDSPARMVAEARDQVNRGFTVLKIKLGDNPELDICRLLDIQEAVGSDIVLRIDANQGWSAKEAVRVGRELERRGVDIELMEQPVAARDFEGLRYVRENVPFPVYADESLFSPRDAMELIEMRAVDGLNIKLMKCGGLYNALKIVAIADTANIPCMIGSMMECNISVTAAAHLAASRSVIGRYDLDAPLFCSTQPARKGFSYRGPRIEFSDGAGLGLQVISEEQTGVGERE